MRFFFILLMFFQATANVPVEPRVKAVAIKDGHLYLLEKGRAVKQLTSGSSDNRLPVWSKDGTEIAYLKYINRKQALDNLIVIDPTGKMLQNFLIRPKSGPLTDGMRYVEGMQWLSKSKIAVSGSINPSTIETLVFDKVSGHEVDDIYDDNGGATFSPNGDHVAYVTGSPHFGPDEDKRPELHVDNLQIYPNGNEHVVFLTEPAWSDDGQELAIVTENFDDKTRYVIAYKPGGVIFRVKLGEEAQPHVSIFWSGRTVVVHADGSKTAVLVEEDSLRVVPLAQITSLTAGTLVSSTIKTELEQGGWREPDLWCASCPLKVMPRGEGMGVH